jgi:hypothetical protein
MQFMSEFGINALLPDEIARRANYICVNMTEAPNLSSDE